MTTATKTRKRAGKTKRKASSGPPRRKAPAKPATNGKAPKAAGQSGKFAKNQPPIKGLEDTDERVPALDELCQKFFAAKDKQSGGKMDEEEAGGQITGMLHEKNLELYIYQGKKFYIEPGCESLKCVKVKQGN